MTAPVSRSSVAARVSVFGIAGVVLLLDVGVGRAGDPSESPALFVNMTPDEHSSAASRTCVNGIYRHLKVKQHYTLERMGESALRRAIGRDDPGFMQWEADLFKPVKEVGEYFEHKHGVILVDCRPEAKLVDVLIERGGNITRLTLRDVPLEGKAEWLGYYIAYTTFGLWETKLPRVR